MSNTTFNNSENQSTVLAIRTIFNIIRRLSVVRYNNNMKTVMSLVTYYYFYKFQENRKTMQNSDGDSPNRRQQY